MHNNLYLVITQLHQLTLKELSCLESICFEGLGCDDGSRRHRDLCIKLPLVSGIIAEIPNYLEKCRDIPKNKNQS